ncbi:MAG: cyclic pyranopterin monophosphate synthase MoaC [Polyangiales bacterium]
MVARKRALAPTHLDRKGHAHVVDVGEKAETRRRAKTEATVLTTAEVARAILDGRVPKGDVAAVVRIAGIQGAKRTSELVPLCHPLGLTHVSADLAVTIEKERGVARILVAAECIGRTGVEMEAMTGASIAALTLYDMIKGLDRSALIARVELLSKSGGRSGDWRRTRGEHE